MIRLFVPLLILCATSYALYGQQIIYVNSSANGFENGTSWNDAYTDFSRALAESKPGNEIWVAEGNYPVAQGGNRFGRFVIDKSLMIYGGFRGDEAVLSDRSKQGESILTGEVSADQIRENNAYNIIRIENAIDLVMDGFTIEGAYGDFIGEDDYNLDEVGAILINNQSNSEQIIKLTDVHFRNNYAADKGGCLFIQDKVSSKTELYLSNCSFESSLAVVDGSAIYIDLYSNEAHISLENIEVSSIDPSQQTNTIVQVVLRGQRNTLDITNGRFTDNASRKTDPIIALGLFGTTDFQFEGNQFIGNEFGQIMFVSASSRLASEIHWKNILLHNNITFSSPLQILNTSFADERTNVFIEGLEISNNQNGDTWILIDLHEINLKKFDNNKFVNNKGGPLYLNPIYAPLTINNCLSAHNQFKDVDFSNQFVFKNFDNFDIDFVNCTFADNDGLYGSVVRTVFNQDNGSLGNINFRNCIFYGNVDEATPRDRYRLVTTRNSNVNFENCLFDAKNCADLASIESMGQVYCNETNIFESDPNFTRGNSYELSFCSPAIDAGNNEMVNLTDYDLNRNSRIGNGRVDMGAYESVPFTRSLGFNCLNGVVYSDWVTGFDRTVNFERLSDPVQTIRDQVTSYVLYAEGGCTDTLLVPAQPLNSVEIFLNDETVHIDYNQAVELSFINYSGGSLEWSVYPESRDLHLANNGKSLSFVPSSDGKYYVVATNEFGCYYIDSISVVLEKFEELIYIPNSFSPNGDGINDDFSIVLNRDEPLVITGIKIYNRYGSLVINKSQFILEDKEVIWGRESGAKDFSPGIYVYWMEGKFGEKTFRLVGDITVFK